MKKWIIIVAGTILSLIAVFIVYGNFKSNRIDENNLPKFIQADFVDLDKIYSISKFRSGSGHSFTDGTETCRSMKHYFNVQVTSAFQKEWDENNNMPKPPSPGKSIDIFSPVDGVITDIRGENSEIGKQIFIKPNQASDFTVRIFHVYLLPGINQGSKVVAGQKIGEIGLHQNTDIAVETRIGLSHRLYSYFNFMTDKLFANYQARGAKSRDEFIITEEDRDANPLQCNGEWFTRNYDNGENNGHFVRLSGWKNSF